MKILMLHGYSQNDGTFQRKLRRLEEQLHKTFPDAQLVWSEGPVLLKPKDVPGYALASKERQILEGPELRAWFELQNVQQPPQGLFRSLDMLAEVLRHDGPFDGVIAFSQGTVFAAIMASLLQGQTRVEAYQRARQACSDVMRYPNAFRDLHHPPFRFGVLYAARVGRTSYYDWLYENPPIDTPFCHFVGMWDPMVDLEERDAVLTKLHGGRRSRTIFHVGGHFVPTDDINNDMVVEFIARCSNHRRSHGSVESVEDGALRSEAVK